MSTKVLDVDDDDLGIYCKLTTLKVENCSSTRVEDKEAILLKIPDTLEFDAQLQSVIFGKHGLLARHLVGFDTLRAAAHSAYRLRTLSEHVAGHQLGTA